MRQKLKKYFKPYNHTQSIMEYQKKFKVIIPPCRFQWLDSNIKLERKIKKDNRKRLVQKARWSKMFSDEMVKESLTRDEIWDKYIEETQ